MLQNRPNVVGKYDDKGQFLQPAAGELSPSLIAKVIASRFYNLATTRHSRKVKFMQDKEDGLIKPETTCANAFFCSGCPHNTSTKARWPCDGWHWVSFYVSLDGQKHVDLHTYGAEGTPWIGQAPFTETEHIFANIGDGTYTHPER